MTSIQTFNATLTSKTKTNHSHNKGYRMDLNWPKQFKLSQSSAKYNKYFMYKIWLSKWNCIPSKKRMSALSPFSWMFRFREKIGLIFFSWRTSYSIEAGTLPLFVRIIVTRYHNFHVNTSKDVARNHWKPSILRCFRSSIEIHIMWIFLI